jgi:hypothetical protein
MSPDYSHWHGLYEVALNFYFHLIPHASQAVAHKNDTGLTQRWEKLKDSILSRQEHKWQKGLPQEELRKIVEFYKERYGKNEN